MPTKRIVAFAVAILLTLITFLTVFMQSACIVGLNEIEDADISSDSDIHPGGIFILAFSGIIFGAFAFIMLGVNVNFSIVALILALSNTKPLRCDVKWVRITSWVIFGTNCAVIVYSIGAIFFI